jgi:hypothetical protein
MKALQQRVSLKLDATSAACACRIGSTGCAVVGGVSGTAKAPAESYHVERGEVQLDVSSVSALLAPGGSCKLAAAREGAAALPILVVRTPDVGFLAFEDRCTSSGAQLEYAPEKKQLHCAGCAGATRFDLSGNVLAGIAPRPLTQLRTALRGNQLTIALA